jgi:hypothetical protein
MRWGWTCDYANAAAEAYSTRLHAFFIEVADSLPFQTRPDQTRREIQQRRRDASGGGAVAGALPAWRHHHDGRRRAPSRLHDLPQQALAVVRLLLQADVGAALSLALPSSWGI